jgi:hypothetical protein
MGRDKPHKPEARSQIRSPSDLSDDKSRECPKPARKRARLSYSSDFEEFWKEYPTDQNMSKAEAYAVWQKLDSDDRKQALESIPGFKAFCAKDLTYRPIHANRYLSKRRFEGHLAKTKEIVARFTAEPYSPQWEAWLKYRRARGERTSWMEAEAREGRPYRAPSEWPPEVVMPARAQSEEAA